MSKRLNPCIRCTPEPEEECGKFTIPRGFTRHDDRVCAQCRRGEPTTAQIRKRDAAWSGRGA